MTRLFYPAIFHPEKVGYSVSVPDLSGCFTQGDTLDEAYEMAFDAIGLCVEDLLENKEKLPKPSLPKDVFHTPDDFVVLVNFSLADYYKKHNSKSVKKTLTIPSWLNAAAEEQHINFSSTLQSALKKQLNME